MRKQIIYCIDNQDFLHEYAVKFKEYFQNFTIEIQNNLSTALLSMTQLVRDGYEIPIVITGHNIFKENEHYFLDGVHFGFKKTRFIVLTDSLIENTKNTLEHLHFIPKNWMDSELILTMREIIKSYVQDIQIENSSQTDSLTGLYNRQMLSLKIEELEGPCVLLLNIDNFRMINKVYGYKFGDKVLQIFAKYLRNIFKKEEVFRHISNEFVILKNNFTPEQAIAFSKVLKQNINEKVFNIEDKQINLTLCIAISTKGNNLIEDAQSTIYQGRKEGKNKIFLADHNILNDKKISYNELKNAFKEDRFIPYYQGIRNNKTKKIDKYECLARMKDKSGEIILPGSFIEELKEVDLLVDLTKVMIVKSFKYLKDKPYDFSINLTDADFKENYIVDFVKEQSFEFGINLNRVMFEILESINIEENNSFIMQIQELKKIGCKIAFDDFGSEKSNFSRMLDLNIDVVKIDRRFIKNIEKDTKSFKLTKAITSLAQDFNCKVIAEGIESENIQTIIENLNIHYTQGYYFDKPSEFI